MYIIEVIPILRSVYTETLLYFSKVEIPVGSIIEIPVRKKKTKALVVYISRAHSAKSSIKSASFSLKKIANPEPVGFFKFKFC